jgi:hypothetical protein
MYEPSGYMRHQSLQYFFNVPERTCCQYCVASYMLPALNMCSLKILLTFGSLSHSVLSCRGRPCYMLHWQQWTPNMRQQCSEMEHLFHTSIHPTRTSNWLQQPSSWVDAEGHGYLYSVLGTKCQGPST